MQSWFVWKGKNSREMGLWVKKLPAETRAEERITLVEVPGRSGHLTMLEGDDVYNSYLKECTVIARRDLNFDLMNDWLSGEGDVIFSSNLNRAYSARISTMVSFDNISNDLCQCKIPFYVQPLKKQFPTEPDIDITAGTAKDIYNPGTVPSLPLVAMSGNHSSLTIAGKSMIFWADAFSQYKDYAVGDMVYHADSLKTYRFKVAHPVGVWDSTHVDECTGIEVDCESKMIAAICNGQKYIFTAPYTGDFWTIPVGETTAGAAGNVSATITPRWRWR